MKQLFILIILLSSVYFLKSQTPLTEATDFHVKTIEGVPIYLYPLLDDNKIVVIDFFSTTCGPCQDYAPDFQEAYEEFGDNQSNVFFMGINWGDDNDGVHEFDSVFGLTYPTASGIQGNGDNVYLDYEILSYPTVIVITPDRQIIEQHIWLPTAENIVTAVIEAGGLYVGLDEPAEQLNNFAIYPNPAVNQAYIKFDLPEKASIKYEVVDLFGNVIYQSDNEIYQAGNNKIKLFVSGLINGQYFVKIMSNETVVKTERFIVAH